MRATRLVRLRPEKVIIDPTSPSSFTKEKQAIFSQLLSAFADQIFVSHTTYEFHDGHSNRKIQCELEHSILRFTSKNENKIAVLAQSSPEDNAIRCYQLAGMLVSDKSVWRFKPEIEHYLINCQNILNPLAMSQQQAVFLSATLFEVFSRNSSLLFFPAGASEYSIIDEQGRKFTILLNLQNPILIRERAHEQDEYRCEVLGPLLGSGNYACVYKTLRTLIPLSDGNFRQKDTPRIVKRQLFITDKELTQGFRLNEWRTGSLIRELHMKPMAFHGEDDKQDSYLTSRFFTGKQLDKTIKLKANKPDVVMQLLLSICLLRTCIRKLTPVKVVHLDLKPDNIIIDNAFSIPRLSIVDLGFALFDGEPLIYPCGTELYFAPEVNDLKNTSSLMDVYSLGVMIMDFWHLIQENENSIPLPAEIVRRMKKQYKECDDFSLKLQNQFLDMVFRMTHADPQSRCNILEAEALFSDLRLQYMKNNSNRQTSDYLSEAHAAARKLRNEFQQHVESRRPWDGTKSIAACDAIQFEGMRRESVRFEFVLTLNIRAFENIKSLEDLRQTMRDIAREYNQAIKTRAVLLTKLERFIKGASFKACHADYQRHLQCLFGMVGRRASVAPSSIDHVVELTEKARHDEVKLREDLNYIEESTPEVLRNTCPVRPWHLAAPPVSLFQWVQDSLQEVNYLSAVHSKIV